MELRSHGIRAAAALAIALGCVAAPGVGAAVGTGATNDATAGGAVGNAVPTPSSPVPGRPTSIAAIGDSITQSTGTGPISKENPQNNWATGWSINSLAARLAIPTNKRYNYAANGNRMTHFAGEVANGKSGGSGDVAPMPADTDLVVVELGGNDLCRDSVAAMTSVADYRAQFKAGLAAVAAKAPDALIQVMSIPDIYNLWYIRGAQGPDPLYHPEPMSDQAQGINGAWDYWDGTFKDLGIFTFPCQSLLDNPGSWQQADIDRRLAVRQRNKEYNQVLVEECAKVLRCATDGKQLFDLTSNRSSPPDGPMLPYNQWRLTDLDISRNEKSLCPATGLTASGCGDHFHPSKAGQEKIALAAYTYGRNYADTTYPIAGGTVAPSTRPDHLNHGRATVSFTGSDDVGLRGQEVRVHHPDGTVSPWAQHIGVAPNLTVSEVGLSYVEVRSLDVNGNLSGGTLIPVTVVDPLLPGTPGTPSLATASSGLEVSWKAPADDGGAAIVRYDLTTLVGSPASPGGAPIPVPGATRTTPGVPPAEVVSFAVAAVNSAGSSASSPASAPTVAPFASLAAFVAQQWRDFAGRAPTSAELVKDVDALTKGTLTPTGLVERLRAGTWFDGAYGPAIRLYKAYFLRQPDPSGIEYWANKRRAGVTLAKISQQFSVSSEFQRRYGELSDAAFVDTIYQNVFGRAPDPSGRAYYLKKLASGWARGQVVLQFSESSEYKRLTTPLVTVLELGRGLTGAPIDQVAAEYALLDYSNGGAKGVVASLTSTSAYRSRVR